MPLYKEKRSGLNTVGNFWGTLGFRVWLDLVLSPGLPTFFDACPAANSRRLTLMPRSLKYVVQPRLKVIGALLALSGLLLAGWPGA